MYGKLESPDPLFCLRGYLSDERMVRNNFIFSIFGGSSLIKKLANGLLLSMSETDSLQLAARLINSTDRHLFLTGKAGTGKTTFLRDLAEATHKNFVIVAPTGIAALNAKGVTIHSQFMLPFGSFLPDKSAEFNGSVQSAFYTGQTLNYKHRLDRNRKQVLRSIDLLIIDEVSMLRADVLDAIDHRLRSVKGNYRQPFGGVQLLMIGDLYQLPPVVKDHEWQYLRSHYNSMYFYESVALRQEGFSYIELSKVFRQKDDLFLRVLNNLRNNACTAEDLEVLNKRYSPNAKPADGIVTITTHNHLANKINREALDRLPGKPMFYEARIEGDFPENLHPLAESLELREGAQVMFIRNDNESKAYYNGKLARVTYLDEDEIRVAMEDDNDFVLRPHTWSNIKYKVGEGSKELIEEEVGKFEQYPLKLAWAITVHKSQGLTFENAIVDVGSAFAPGQVYVALSRLRSLEGLILRTQISESVIASDSEVVRFSKQQSLEPSPEQSLELEQQRYLERWFNRAFNFREIVAQIAYTQEKTGSKIDFEDLEMREALASVKVAFEGQLDNTAVFTRQVVRLLQVGDKDQLLDRLKKGSKYFLDFLYGQMRALWIHKEEVSQLAKTKTYVSALNEVDQLLVHQAAQLQKAAYLSHCILSGIEPEKQDVLTEERLARRKSTLESAREYVRQNPKNFATKTGRARKPTGETYQISYALFKSGLDIDGVANERGLARSTIEGHLARGIADKELEITPFIEEDALKEIEAAFASSKDQAITAVRGALNNKYSFGQLRMVQAWLMRDVS